MRSAAYDLFARFNFAAATIILNYLLIYPASALSGFIVAQRIFQVNNNKYIKHLFICAARRPDP